MFLPVYSVKSDLTRCPHSTHTHVGFDCCLVGDFEGDFWLVWSLIGDVRVGEGDGDACNGEVVMTVSKGLIGDFSRENSSGKLDRVGLAVFRRDRIKWVISFKWVLINLTLKLSIIKMSCLFCKIVSVRIEDVNFNQEGSIPCHRLLETPLTLAFLDINPLSLGHVLIIPKSHASKLHQVSDEHLADILPVSKRIAVALGCEDYNLVQNNGRLAHQDVDHCH